MKKCLKEKNNKVHIYFNSASRDNLLSKIIFHLNLYDYYDLKNIYNLLLSYDNEMGYRE